MKTKILTLFLLLLIGVGTSFAQVKENFILKSLEERGISFENWLSTPGTGDEKLSALLLEGKWILLEDSTRVEPITNSIGTRCVDRFKIKRMIRYNSKMGFETKTKTVYQGRKGMFWNLICGVIMTLLIVCLMAGSDLDLFSPRLLTLAEGFIFGIIIYGLFNVYLGAFVCVLTIIALIRLINKTYIRRITLQKLLRQRSKK